MLALTGSVLFDGHSEERKLAELKPTKIRGVAVRCDGLLAARAGHLREQGRHEGIIILEDDAPVGMPLADFMGDIVIEIDVLPNMARCLSMIGVAREVAAITGAEAQTALPPGDEGRRDGEPIAGQVKVADRRPEAVGPLCRRASSRTSRSAPPPAGCSGGCTYAGMRPINNIVDITNYVMLEWGQPLHAFDYDVLVQACRRQDADDHRPARPRRRNPGDARQAANAS